MNRLIVTFFYSGLLKPAPGTWGSAAALIVGWALHTLGGPGALALATTLLFVAALYAIRAETEGKDDPDPSEIVADEAVGQWIALLPVSVGAAAMQADILRLWPGLIAAFLLFRLFDIWKPGPVAWADRRKDPIGVLLDDVIAGVFAACGVVVLAGLSHGLLMK